MRWDLESIIKRENISSVVSDFVKHLERYKNGKTKSLEKKIVDLQSLASKLKELESYIECLIVQDMTDQEAKQLKNMVIQHHAELESEHLKLIETLGKLDSTSFAVLMNTKECEHLKFYFSKEITALKEKNDKHAEDLIVHLSPDGFHSWFGMYQEIIGNMSIPCVIQGKKKTISAASAHNYLSETSRSVRKEVFTQWEKVCEKEKMTFARILNHIAGFRLSVLSKRGWDSHLKEALLQSNMEEKTLFSMWEAVSKSRDIFHPFYKMKAAHYKVKKLSWYDLEAPLFSSFKKCSYKKYIERFIGQLTPISEDMAAYTKHACESGWLDVEERKNKAPGGFCTPFPESGASRIYLSYAGHFDSERVVAHELGHGYHGHELFHLPYFAQKYPMCLAEMASTFFEQITMDGYIQNAQSSEEKKKYLFEKVQRHASFLQNIYARFVFENNMYEKRKQGFLLPDELSQLMINAQKEAYGTIFESYHPYFWITKLHFYLTDISFYNFPYTVGYLLSVLLLQQAKESPKEFGKKYKALLLDTGRLSVEDVIKKHFHGCASDSNFWKQALDIIKNDVDQLVECV